MKCSTFILAVCTAWTAIIGAAQSAHAATFVVTTTEDDVAGSLRRAITNANARSGADVINFNIASGGLKTIAPMTELPAITDTITIDGYSQPGSKVNAKALGDDAVLKIELSGRSAPVGARGLFLDDVSGCVVRGLIINRWATSNEVGAGLFVLGNSNTIAGCFIGPDAAGQLSRGNVMGIVLGGVNNRIGGTTPAMRNLISGNLSFGVSLSGKGNRVQGNLIGTDASGASRLNTAEGRVIFSYGIRLISASATLIGGAESGARNVISANVSGISLEDSSSNRIQGNLIGVNATGDGVLSNAIGIDFLTGSKSNLIGGAGAGEGNTISGNLNNGILFRENGNDENRIQGNKIGTDPTGRFILKAVDGFFSSSVGVSISSASSNNLIGGARVGEGNQISGNDTGIAIGGSGNRIQGNAIGTDRTGTSVLGNGVGIAVGGGTHGCIIGGGMAGQGNLIAGSATAGIQISGGDGSTFGNVIQGNRIGTDNSGTRALGNDVGIKIGSATHDNLIGGANPDQGNLISGNRNQGILFFNDNPGFAANSNRNSVQGNRIGTNVSGTRALPNANGILILDSSSNTIGGLASGAGNLISGNSSAGVAIATAAARTNAVKGNLVGTDISGKRALGNNIGILVAEGATGNLIGGTTEGERNIISGNRSDGVLLQTAATGNAIRGNFIGTNVSGTGALPNDHGIYMDGAVSNTIGGAEGARNLISGNMEKGSGLWIEAATTACKTTSSARMFPRRGRCLTQPASRLRARVTT